jgi:hypothetical protein
MLLAGLGKNDESLPVSPPKVVLSPSGLPVGSLEGKVQRSVGRVGPNLIERRLEVSTFRLWVRPDGTGSLRNLGDFSAQQNGYEVTLVRLGPGRVALSYEGPICANPRAATLDFTVHGRSVTVDDVTTKGCILSVVWARDLVGAKLEVQPLPPGL